MLAANPLRRAVPAWCCPDGQVMTESAAILIRLEGELHPEAGRPGADDPRRSAFLRWMAFVSSAIYAHFWLKDDPSRLVPDTSTHAELRPRIHERISECWGIMEARTGPGH